MISIICVYDDVNILRVNLLSSLKEQNTKFELILVDNTKALFKSLPKALNYGGNQAKGEYLMFVHQDVELIGSDWLRRAEKFLTSINDLGVAGVAGVDFDGNPVGFIVDRGRLWGSPIKNPKPVMTLDEQLLIIPRDIFNIMKFDEGFKWHSWAADICLRVQEFGLKTYVLPLLVSHNSSTLPILKAGRIEDDDLKLWMKYRRKYPVIYKTTGAVTSRYFTSYSRKVPRLKHFLKSLELGLYKAIYDNYKTMLDIVVPYEEPYIKSIKSSISYSVGISNKIQYLLASKRIKVHEDYIYTSLEKLPFRDKAFDIIIVRGYLEYLRKYEGKRLLNALEGIGRRIVISVPNNGLPIDPAYRYYRSVWSVDELKSKGYKVYGFGLRIEVKSLGIFGKFLNYIMNPISRHLPYISKVLIATKKSM